MPRRNRYLDIDRLERNLHITGQVSTFQLQRLLRIVRRQEEIIERLERDVARAQKDASDAINPHHWNDM